MLKLFTPARSLAILAFLTWVLVLFVAPRHDLLAHSQPAPPIARALPLLPDAGGSSDAASANSDTAAKASDTAATSQTSAAAESPAQSTPAQQSSASATDAAPSQTATPTPSSTPPASSNTDTPSQSSQPPSDTAALTTPPASSIPPAQHTVSTSTSTDSNGDIVFVSVTVTPSLSSASTSPSANADQDNKDDGGSKKVGTSTIVGLSVAGGIALIGIVGFIVWKFTRKRFADDFDDSTHFLLFNARTILTSASIDEAIKWPDLNAHGNDGVALPIGRSGNAGFETNSEVNLTRPDSRAGSTYASSAAASAVDLYAPHASQDPYAVPPLPHLNPNQPPYRDDPDAAYYDPYHGPVPGTFADGGAGENIPMTQINRTRSPAPQMAYDAGRRSPGPGMAYAGDGRMSPGPGMAYAADGGRVSPAPQVALSGRASPGPQAAYGYGGRQSPGPGMAYGHAA